MKLKESVILTINYNQNLLYLSVLKGTTVIHQMNNNGKIDVNFDITLNVMNLAASL